MNARKLVVVCMFGALGLMLLSGCLFQEERTNNQGGSNIIQASSKFANDQLGQLNPDDIQVLADLATSAAGLDLPQVTDDQAAALIQFLADNDIATQADVQGKLQQAEEDPSSIVISDEVMAVFEALAGNAAAFEGLG
ncbi:MAG: hypothetical protein KAY37_16395 [Phycisphaerae bacterium]|nr:hypothetical protein [Phycisphaerae bacterium]